MALRQDRAALRELPWSEAPDRLAVNQYAAGGRSRGAADDADDRRLAGTVRADQYRGLAFANGDVDTLQQHVAARLQTRSEERRVGKECVSTCRSRGSPYP